MDRKNNTFIFDTDGLPHDQYRYHLGDRNRIHHFSFVSEGEQTVLATAAFVGDNNNVRPQHQISWTNFNKKSSTTTPLGETTQYFHNKLDKLSKQVFPTIPVVDTSGNISQCAGEIDIGYNESGAKIGVRNENSNVELFSLDEANLAYMHTAGDGVPYFIKTFDVFGNAIEVMSASGNVWKKVFDNKGSVIQITLPSGDVWNYFLNENGFLIKSTPPTGSAVGSTLYGQGPFGDMNVQILPKGDMLSDTHNRHHQLLTHQAFNRHAVFVYGTSQQYSFSGKQIGKTDAAGSTFQTNYFFDGSIQEEVAVNIVNPAQMLQFDSAAGTFSTSLVPTPPKKVSYGYINSLRPNTITDASNHEMTKIFDINRNIVNVNETNGAGGVLRNMAEQYNARHWPTTQTDTNFSLDYSFDSSGDRRRMDAVCNGLTHDGWWTTDVASRVLVNDGQMIDGVIQSVQSGDFGYLAPTQGNTFSYANGSRVSQSILVPNTFGQYADANGFPAVFGYNVNDAISSIATIPQAHFISTATPLDISFDMSSPTGTLLVYWTPPPGVSIATVTGIAIFNGSTITGQAVADNGCFFPIVSQDHVVYTVVATLTTNDGTVFQGATQAFLPAQSINYPENLNYTPDGLLSTVTMKTVGNWNGGAPFISTNLGYDLNGNMKNYFNLHFDGNNSSGRTLIDNTHFNIDGNYLDSTFTWNGVTTQSFTDTSTNTLRDFDTTVVNQTSATRHNVNGNSATMTSERFFDSNNALNGASNIANPFNSQDQNPHYLYVDNSLDGRPLAEFIDNASTSERFYHDNDGNIIAEYGTVVNSYNNTQIALQLISPVSAFNVANIMGQTGNVIVEPGDTWARISYRLFRDPNYASILHAYSGVRLIAGQTINLKQTLSAYNKVHDYAPSEQLMSAIYNSINPALKTPEPPPPPPPKPHHESFWDELIGGIVAVVTMIVVPEFAAPALISFFAGGAAVAGTAAVIGGTVVAAGFAGALASAAQQGIAIAFGDQHGFSLSEIVDYATTSAITTGLGKVFKVGDLLHDAEYLETFTKFATIATTVQLFEMSVGLRKQLDIKLILEQAIANTVSGKLDAKVTVASATIRPGIDELANTAIGEAFGYSPDITSLAANYVGDIAGDQADVLAQQIIQPQEPGVGGSGATTSSANSVPMGYAPNPQNFTDSALQTESQYIANSLISDDAVMSDPTASFYTAYRDTQVDAVNDIAQANYAAASNVSSNSASQVRASRVQNAATGNASGAGQAGWLVRDIYNHQNALWARGVLAISGAVNSEAGQWLLRSLNSSAEIAEQFNPISAMMEAATGTDPVTGQSISIGQAYENFGSSVAGLFGGEVVGAGLDYASTFIQETLPSVAGNWASMFGGSDVNALSPMRLRVMENIADSQAASSTSGFGVFSQRAMARAFYSEGGWASSRIDSHLDGIDFNSPVAEYVVPNGDILEQHQMPGAPIGNYFAEPGASSSNLGIYTSGRVLNRYMALADIRMLCSTSSSIVDRWSMAEYGWNIELEGGETQYFTHNLSDWRRV